MKEMINKIANLVVLCIFFIHMSGCAAILKPRDTQMKVDSEPQGAEIYLAVQEEKIVRVGRTPAVIPLDNKHNAELTFKKAGYEDGWYMARSKVDHSWMLLSFVCVILPAFIDLASRSARSFKEKEIKVILDPILPK